MKNSKNKIMEYLLALHVFSLFTVSDNIPWAASCFYVVDLETDSIIFLSSDETKHSCHIMDNCRVAGTVSNQESNVKRIRGIQFSGTASRLAGEDEKKARHLYYSKFPLARLMESPIWAVKLDYVKMTDNTLGFGKKIIWEAE
jgi:uncharacterized protein YhbP (UPF0306 family)